MYYLFRFFILITFFNHIAFSGSSDSNSYKDLTLIINEDMLNRLSQSAGSIKNKGKAGIISYRSEVSNLVFNFFDGQGKIKVDISLTNKKGKDLIRKTILADLILSYDSKKNIIKLDIDNIKIDFGKIFGKIKITNLIKTKSFELPGPKVDEFKISGTENLIQPKLIDVEASFIKDHIKVGYNVGYD